MVARVVFYGGDGHKHFCGDQTFGKFGTEAVGMLHLSV